MLDYYHDMYAKLYDERQSLRRARLVEQADFRKRLASRQEYTDVD